LRTMPAVPRLKFQRHRLGNGLEVLLYRDNSVPLAHVSVHYRVGSSYETPGRSGLAHLFEHMMFEGSDNVPRNDHGKLIDAAGGSWNASTNKDRTNYYETVPSHYVELALWLEADRMRSLRVTDETFENQRQTVIEEKKQSYDNRPYGLAHLRFDELSYENWAYGHPIIGSVDDLMKASLEDARRFHGAYYGPGNAALAVAGDIDEESVLQQVELHFGNIEDRTSPRQPDLSEPVQQAEKREVMPDPLAVLPAVSLGYHMPELGTDSYYALSLLAVVLSQGPSSRLYEKLVHDRNWAMSLYAGPNQYKGPELFLLWFQLQAGVPVSDLLQAVDEEILKIAENRIQAAELEKARNQVSHSFVARLAKISQIGEGLARCAVYFDDPEYVNLELDRYLSMTREDIMSSAQSVFRPENRTVIIAEPAASLAEADGTSAREQQV
jgi:zinc protease